MAKLMDTKQLEKNYAAKRLSNIVLERIQAATLHLISVLASITAF
jgi:hypothetical protein